MKTKEELLKALADCVCDMEDGEVIDVVHEPVIFMKRVNISCQN